MEGKKQMQREHEGKMKRRKRKIIVCKYNKNLRWVLYSSCCWISYFFLTKTGRRWKPVRTRSAVSQNGFGKKGDGEVADVRLPLGRQLEELDIVPFHSVNHH